MQEQIASRVSVLMAQKRYQEVEVLIKELLSTDADNVYYLAWLAEAAIPQGKLEIADSAVRQAIAISPDTDYLYYIKARIAIEEDDHNAALTNIKRAIALDPLDEKNYSLLAALQFDNQQYELALETANKALEINPEHVYALNTRSRALRKLKHHKESLSTLQGALRDDPDNYYTHANYGWALLENGDYKRAQEHFKQALQNNPGYQNAQTGMREAIKAGNQIYRLFLKYSFFMQSLTNRFQWFIIIGYYFLVKALTGIARHNSALQPYLYPVIIILSLAAFSLWIIEPVGNLYLSFHPYGRHLLDNKKKLCSRFVATSFIIFVVGLLLFGATKQDIYLPLAAFGFLMMLPLSNIFKPAKYKHTFLIFTLALAIVGIMAITTTFLNGKLFNIFTGLFLLGFFAFQIAANYIRFYIRD